LKRAMTEEPVLVLPDFSKPYEVHTDASDFTIGGVLLQEGHLWLMTVGSLMVLRGGT